MLNNKNNIMSTLNIFSNPFAKYGQTWRLTFNPVYSLIMLLGIGICASAANWQFTKAQFYLAPLAQTLHMEGRYLNEYTHYLDNQTFKGKAGYAVITPFEYDGTTYLVNRGFISYKNRNELPKVSGIEGSVTLTGHLKEYQKPMLLNDSLQDPLYLRVQYINNNHFSLMLSRTVSEKIFQLEKGEGLVQAFPRKEPYLNHHRHMGYAIQWGLLAIAGLIIWLIASIKKSKKND
jgi:surfeit locus 1 family protein